MTVRPACARRYLAERFDIDFVALTFTQDGADVRAAREALADAGLYETKILAKARHLTSFDNFIALSGTASLLALSRPS